MRPLGTLLTRSVAAPLGLGPRAPGGGLLLRDTFTGPDGTALAAHPMEIGSGWTVHQGGAALAANRARLGSLGSGRMVATASAGRANVAVRLTVNSGGALSQGLVLRFQDPSNYWLLYVTGAGMTLHEVNAGSFVVRAQRAIALSGGTDYQLEAVCAGLTISATLNGGNPIQYASATHLQTAVRFGLYGEQVGQQFDQFEVRP
ncbi:MAG: hypothetical protein ACK47B_22480 [Armatimonadota bacterium]